MSKQVKQSRLANNEAIAKSNLLRISPQKLNYVAELIRNMKASDAMVQLTFSKKRIAKDVKKCLQSAIANAENNNNLNVDKLVIVEATVGKSLVMKRMHARARGRGTRIEKFFSNLSIIVREEK